MKIKICCLGYASLRLPSSLMPSDVPYGKWMLFLASCIRLNKSYYEGTISSFDTVTKKHKVEYDDGDEEVLNLRTEQWEFLGDEIPTDIDIFVDKKFPQPRSNTPNREGSTVCEKETSQTNTRNREIIPASEAEADDGSHQVAEVVEKVKTPEGLSEMKRPRLSDGQKS